MVDSLARGEIRSSHSGLTKALVWAFAVAGLVAAPVLVARDHVGVAPAAALASLGVTASVALAAILEMRARDRLRHAWLERLHRLTDDLAGALSAADPSQAVRTAAERATSGIAAPRAMADEIKAFLRSVDDQSAQAHERIALAEARRRAQADLELLARATPRLAASLDVQRVGATIEELVVPTLADGCSLWVRPRVGQGGAERPPLPSGARRVRLEEMGRLVGELTVHREAGDLSDADLDTIALLAEPAARSLAHAVRFTEEAHTSSILQNSLLPRALLPIPGLEVATRYLAATENQAVGGDFYDVIHTGAGTSVLIVGDVQGKGVEAAALTSTARHTLRSAALEGATPAEMLRLVNEALLYADAERVQAVGQPSVRFVTAAVVALSPEGEGFSAVVASGGHPPPLVIRPDGAVEQVVADGPLMGVFADASYKERSVALGLSDTVVLYTDGVTEQRRAPELFDEVQLGRLVRNQLTVRRADDVAQLILDTVVDLNPRESRDDIALVVARVTGSSEAV